MKRTLCLFLVAVMLLGALTACSSGSKERLGASSGAAKDENTVAPAQETKAPEAADNGTYEQLTLVLTLNGTEPADKALVAEELSKITREKIGSEVTLKYVSGSTYADQLNLMLASEEDVDLVFVPSVANGVGMAQNGAFYPLDELLAKNGQEVVKALGEDIAYTINVDGSVYMVPTVKETAKGSAIVARKDILDALGVDPASIHTMDDYETVLKQVKEKYPDMIPFLPCSMYACIGLTVLNGSDRLYDEIGVLMDINASELTVENVFATDRYKAHVDRMNRWYEEGLIAKDVLNQSKEITSLAQAGRLFSYVNMQKPGQAQIQTTNMGYDMCLIVLDDIPNVSDTETLLATCFAIPHYAKNPEKSMALLNLMYSDADIANLLGCGIEGVHYEVTDDGFAKFANGLTSTTTGYYYNGQLTVIGNEFLTHPWEGNDADIWAQYEAFNSSAEVSPVRGFIFDSTPVKTKYAAVKNVISEYRESLEYGVVNPDEILPEFISKLEAAGINEVIAEKQTQLNAWLAENK